MLRFTKVLMLISLAAAVGCGIAASSGTVDLKDVAPAAADPSTEAIRDTQTAVFAGGCFWGIEAVFEHVKGVIDVRSGYAGGDRKTADYESVSSGDTDHAEAVEIVYDPAKVSYAQLLNVFFSVAHDPTQLNRQGPDSGRQYRSAVFTLDDAQKTEVTNFVAEMEKAKKFSKPIVTEIAPLKKFYVAEAYHQDYMKKNPNQPYIVINDRPKVEALKKEFPELYK